MGKTKLSRNLSNFQISFRQISKILINLMGNNFRAGSFMIEERPKSRSNLIQVKCQSYVTDSDQDRKFCQLKIKTNLF